MRSGAWQWIATVLVSFATLEIISDHHLGAGAILMAGGVLLMFIARVTAGEDD